MTCRQGLLSGASVAWGGGMLYAALSSAEREKEERAAENASRGAGGPRRVEARTLPSPCLFPHSRTHPCFPEYNHHLVGKEGRARKKPNQPCSKSYRASPELQPQCGKTPQLCKDHDNDPLKNSEPERGGKHGLQSNCTALLKQHSPWSSLWCGQASLEEAQM